MRRTNKRELNLNQSSPKEIDLNKSYTGCAPCLNEAKKIDRQVNKRSLNEIKIDLGANKATINENYDN